jgi:hypothetical protein
MVAVLIFVAKRVAAGPTNAEADAAARARTIFCLVLVGVWLRVGWWW